MPNKPTLTTEVAREYRKKYGSKVPNLTLARILYKENKDLYTSVDHARTSLRLIEGKTGKVKAKDKSLFVPERPRNPYNLPDSEEKDIKPFILKNAERVLILSDIHIPYHSIEALTLAMDYGKERKVDTIILNGDICDFYQMSRFEKDPRKRSIAHELEATRSFLTTLRKEFPKAQILFKCGNHDLRFEKYLVVKAPELLGITEFELKNLLNLKSLDITWIEDKRIIKLKSLNILHGHEYTVGSFNPVNVARGLFMKANAIAIQGHNHQTSENTVTTLDGNMITTWSTGCMCELQPAYLPYNRWNLGFAYVEVEGDNFEVFNKRIKNGKVF